MLKVLTTATALLLAVSSSAALAAPPADAEACNKLAFDLADKAMKKKLPEAEAAKVDEKLLKVEESCGAGKFADADAAAKEAEALIGK